MSEDAFTSCEALPQPPAHLTLVPDLDAAPGMADVVTEVSYFARNPATAATIEQAKGALMAVYGLNEDAAYDLLRWHSQNRNIKVRDLAAALTAALHTGSSGSEATLRLDRLLDSIAVRR